MKFGKITSKNVSQNALTLAGALAGGAVSGGIVTMVPAQQKLYARAGITAVGALGAAAVKGTGAADQLVKFVLIGMAIRQGAEMIKEGLEPHVQVDENATTANKFVAGMVGLACPCENAYGALNAAPVINFDALPARSSMPQINEVHASERAQEKASDVSNAF